MHNALTFGQPNEWTSIDSCNLAYTIAEGHSVVFNFYRVSSVNNNRNDSNDSLSSDQKGYTMCFDSLNTPLYNEECQSLLRSVLLMNRFTGSDESFDEIYADPISYQVLTENRKHTLSLTSIDEEEGDEQLFVVETTNLARDFINLKESLLYQLKYSEDKFKFLLHLVPSPDDIRCKGFLYHSARKFVKDFLFPEEKDEDILKLELKRYCKDLVDRMDEFSPTQERRPRGLISAIFDDESGSLNQLIKNSNTQSLINKALKNNQLALNEHLKYVGTSLGSLAKDMGENENSLLKNLNFLQLNLLHNEAQAERRRSRAQLQTYVQHIEQIFMHNDDLMSKTLNDLVNTIGAEFGCLVQESTDDILCGQMEPYTQPLGDGYIKTISRGKSSQLKTISIADCLWLPNSLEEGSPKIFAGNFAGFYRQGQSLINKNISLDHSCTIDRVRHQKEFSCDKFFISREEARNQGVEPHVLFRNSDIYYLLHPSPEDDKNYDGIFVQALEPTQARVGNRGVLFHHTPLFVKSTDFPIIYGGQTVYWENLLEINGHEDAIERFLVDGIHAPPAQEYFMIQPGLQSIQLKSLTWKEKFEQPLELIGELKWLQWVLGLSGVLVLAVSIIALYCIITCIRNRRNNNNSSINRDTKSSRYSNYWRALGMSRRNWRSRKRPRGFGMTEQDLAEQSQSLRSPHLNSPGIDRRLHSMERQSSFKTQPPSNPRFGSQSNKYFNKSLINVPPPDLKSKPPRGTVGVMNSDHEDGHRKAEEMIKKFDSGFN